MHQAQGPVDRGIVRVDRSTRLLALLRLRRAFHFTYSAFVEENIGQQCIVEIRILRQKALKKREERCGQGVSVQAPLRAVRLMLGPKRHKRLQVETITLEQQSRGGNVLPKAVVLNRRDK